MTTTDTLTQKRTKQRNKKPAFVVRESSFSARVKARWRYPRGKHSKIRQNHRGTAAKPNPGYGAAKNLFGLHKTGLMPVHVSTTAQLENIDSAKECAIISRSLGNKKRLAFLNLAEQKKITIVNIVNPTKKIEKITNSLADRKKVRADKLASKNKKTKEKKEVFEQKKEKDKEEKNREKESSVEDKLAQQEEEKKQVEKVLTKKQ
jgi:large subunit ribosomal protein L32e